MTNTANTSTIRESTADELDAVLSLYTLAFPDEELRPLVTELLTADMDLVSLVAVRDAMIIAHVIFTRFHDRQGALLGPLGVLPAHQRHGLGTQIVREGVAQLQSEGAKQIFVLGDPAYYGRLGFEAEKGVATPYPLPAEWDGAWQSMLLAGADPLPAGPCVLPDPWMKPELWG